MERIRAVCVCQEALLFLTKPGTTKCRLLFSSKCLFSTLLLHHECTSCLFQPKISATLLTHFALRGPAITGESLKV